MMRITACARGRVQGVRYRYFVTDCARDTGVSGFVENMPDGSVTIVAEGSEYALDKFVKILKRPADMLIRVDTLEVTRHVATGEFSGFRIHW